MCFQPWQALIILLKAKTRGKLNASAAGKMWVLVFLVGIVVWRVWETFHKQGSARGQTTMLWSFYALFALSCVVFGGTILEFFLVDRAFHPGVAWGGVVLWGAASLIRAIAIRTLGRFWSLHVEIREQHDFVRDGPYQYVRHPAYLSFVLEHIAVPMVGNAWWTLAVVLFVYVPLILFRIKQEEVALVAKFGDTYRVYQRQVGALWPKLGDVGRRVDLC
jgi:protein-S-isoprenylcysteine O-methyltransferase Ste14